MYRWTDERKVEICRPEMSCIQGLWRCVGGEGIKLLVMYVVCYNVHPHEICWM